MRVIDVVITKFTEGMLSEFIGHPERGTPMRQCKDLAQLTRTPPLYYG